MKIAIIGTRGIPNYYGGFEQFAEDLSVRLVKKGFQVHVYNPHFHKYKNNFFNGVTVVRKYSPEKLLGPFANYVYDFLCLKDAIKRNSDILLACGYTSSPVFYNLFNMKKTILISNMDGLEWKRKKWGFIAKKLILLGEKLAVKKSDYLIADNLFISEYLKNKFSRSSEYIPYAANIIEKSNLNENVLKEYDLKENDYYLIVGRGVPENNFEKIIKGFLLAQTNVKFLIVSNPKTRFTNYLKRKYRSYEQIKFIGSIYDEQILGTLRFYSRLYFHGHSVGGTNPSLLEAMAAKCLICAHDNDFNKSVLGENGLYFKNEEDIKKYILSVKELEKSKNSLVQNNLDKIKRIYNWDNITEQYEQLFLKAVREKSI